MKSDQVRVAEEERRKSLVEESKHARMVCTVLIVVPARKFSSILEFL